MNHLSFLIKPASGKCNMRCRYCFYEDEITNRETVHSSFMQISTSERLIDEAFRLISPNGTISFAFQGGEPTLAGLSFFKHFVDYAGRRNQMNIQVQYSIQTNGLLIDSEWCSFLKKHDFLTGISLDGDEIVHNLWRPDTSGKGTYHRTLDAVHLLLEAGVECNILCVVTKQCAQRADSVYSSLKETGVESFQFIPCLDPIGDDTGTYPWSLHADLYGKFLCDLFDIWYDDRLQGKYYGIRLFEDYVRLAMGLPAGTCAATGSCGSYLVVESDGSVYPCDFYALDEWCMGNISKSPLKTIMQSPTGVRFLTDNRNKPMECASCAWRLLCFGGCPRDWIINENGNRSNRFCESFRHFFSYAGTRLNQVIREIQHDFRRSPENRFPEIS